MRGIEWQKYSTTYMLVSARLEAEKAIWRETLLEVILTEGHVLQASLRGHVCVLIIVFHHCNARRRQWHVRRMGIPLSNV